MEVGFLRMTSANISTQYQINNNTFKRGQSEGQIEESTSGGGRLMIYLEYHKIFQTLDKIKRDEEVKKKLI